MNCPHCGMGLAAEMVRCPDCGWKIRLSQILVHTENAERAHLDMPASEICYLFADQFLDETMVRSYSGDVEYLISDHSPVAKGPLAAALCKVALLDMVASGHIALDIVTSKTLVLAKSRSVVVAKPSGIYDIPAGTLESRLLEGIYDKRRGVSVSEALEKSMGFWYSDDPYEWVVRIVRQHLLASTSGANGKLIDALQMARLRPRAQVLKQTLDSFSSSRPGLVAALAGTIWHGLDRRKR